MLQVVIEVVDREVLHASSGTRRLTKSVHARLLSLVQTLLQSRAVDTLFPLYDMFSSLLQEYLVGFRLTGVLMVDLGLFWFFELLFIHFIVQAGMPYAALRC